MRVLHIDKNRVLVTEAFEDLIIDCISHLSDKHFKAAIQVSYHMCYLSKQVRDSSLSFHAFNLLGQLFHTLKLYKEALLIFEFLRDMANEFHNFAYLILSFESIAKVLNDMKDYERGLIAAKKMMQVAWFIGSHEFELYAYE